jgi:hypothetical protein
MKNFIATKRKRKIYIHSRISWIMIDLVDWYASIIKKG